MEKEKKGLFHYFFVEDVLEKGEGSKMEIEADPSKDMFTKIVEGVGEGGVLTVEAIIIFLARFSLLAPAMRAAILIKRKAKEFTSGETSHDVE